MGRSSRDKNEEEHLRGILRNLRSENKHLKKQLARLQKQMGRAEIELSHYDESIEIVPQATVELDTTKCPKCHKSVNPIDMGKRKVINCTHCGYRGTYK